MAERVLTDMERLGALDDAERTFQMNEDAFRIFYEQTARRLWLYLARVTGDVRLADDLLQEAYYRFLRANVSFESDEHRLNYLFRIATNLVRDHHRRPPQADAPIHDELMPAAVDRDPSERATRRIDLSRAFHQLKPRERSLLWLAYAQGWSHREIAQSLGVKTSSLKTLLHRARRRLIELLADPRASRSSS